MSEQLIVVTDDEDVARRLQTKGVGSVDGVAVPSGASAAFVERAVAAYSTGPDSVQSVDTDHPLPVYDEAAAHQEDAVPPRALQYARDANDRMRVSLDALTAGNLPVSIAASAMGNVPVSIAASVALVNSLSWLNAGAYGPWYGTGAPASMDAREQYEQSTRMEYQATRNRWSIT